MENLQGEHNRTLEETKKEKVPKKLFSTYDFVLYENDFSWASFFFCSFYQLLLTNQLEMEKMKVEQEKKKCYLAQEALKEKV